MADFHFIRPLWLLAIIVLIFMLFMLKKLRVKQSGWQQLLPAHLAKVLVQGNTKAKSSSLALPFFIGLLAIIAMAGPSWQKLPQPVYQVAQGSVLIMDMSYSMYSTDVSPNRLTRARYKAIDLLDNIKEGEIGLIAYAGDAFNISPLTGDSNNIKLLLPSLSPELMPVLGSNPFAALTLANEMLVNAGHNTGDIYWFTDGIDNIDIQDITQWSRNHPYRLNILGVGTKTGAPIKLNNGELMKDDNGAIIVPKLTVQALRGLAKRGRGNYTTLTHDNKDIERLTFKTLLSDTDTDNTKESENTGDQWQEFGPYLLLLVLPLLLSYFRRGALLVTLPFALMLMPNNNAHADLWQDLWKTKDQQGQAHFKSEQYQQAAEQFKNPLWQGSAHYKAGDYEQALAAFQQESTADALYNQGNALAKLQKVDEAIAAYDKALQLDPNLADAKKNKAILEQLKQQQENQEQESGDDKQQQDKDKDQQNQNGESQDSQSQDGESKDGESKEGDQQKSEQQGQQNSEPQDQSEQGESSEQKNSEEQQAQKDQQQTDSEQQEQSEEQQAKNAQQAKDAEETNDAQSAAAQQVAEQLAKETEQKHQQLLNKVTDDPYMLLRNKMQLEYQKRNQDRRNVGVKKKW
ncbi:tetratricopeptide repeat protein [Colwellia sp. BRX10-3]|uniref:vWA domain-containing protein n=1 Tax=Colwellia sp. BRX10-3 TaxID=2759844 RepID=UPI0015F6D7F8|nr:tetratricopeptide repeat protein [Colwellia sp. BRX10-3]MBA6389379.1 tetratricopeptide repeat protein [Colwellia sp. BRX10-3]